jgi:hypothetical protein
MDLTTALQNVNYLAVLVAAIIGFAVGAMWYSPVLFAKPWSKYLGFKEDDMSKSNMPLLFGLCFACILVFTFVLALFMGPNRSLVNGLVAGVLAGFGMASTTVAINYLFGRKPLGLFLIDAGYMAVMYTIIGVILGLWK